MFRNYAKIAFRNIRRQKIYSFINIAGLVMGMACAILILAWIQDELSYDRFHRHADCIYRIAQTEHRDAGDYQMPLSYSAMSPILMNEYPGIEHFVRFSKEVDVTISNENKCFIEQGFFYADSTVFRVFDFSLIEGDSLTALEKPYSLVITETAAKKYFGSTDAMGKVLNINDEKDYLITGIIRDAPQQSHMHFDFLASFSSLNEKYGPVIDSYWAHKCYTYLFIPNPIDALKMNQEFSDFILNHKGETWQSYRDFFLQPLNKIHLYSNLNFEIEPNGDIRYVTIFPLIGIIILLIACINYMNLSTARATLRTMEIGIRKVLGACRKDLIGQLLSESILFSVIALPLAILLVEFSMPLFNQISGKSLSIDYGNNISLFLGLIGLLVFVGIVSGSYPAFFLSSFHHVNVLKGGSRLGVSAGLFRKVLVVGQFSIFIVLIVSTLIVRKQLNFIKNERLGFEKENVIVLRIESENLRKSYLSLKNELRQSPEIQVVAGSTGIPGNVTHLSVFRPEGLPKDQHFSIRNLCVDHDFIRTMNIKLKEGRDFSKDIFTDAKEAFIINEAAAQLFGWEASIGRELEDLEFRIQGRVIGLTENFHFRSKHHKIEPLVIQILPNEKLLYYISIKINSTDIKRTLDYIESKWKAFSPHRPMNFFFLDEYFDRMYRKEERLNNIFQSFTILTILIACLGVFGLSAFASEQRKKEIGIRKVLGGSVFTVVFLLSRNFIGLILIANIVSWPIAYYAISQWLNHFAYRVDIGLETFIISAVLALSVSMLTMSFQTIKAAIANPADSLRYE